MCSSDSCALHALHLQLWLKLKQMHALRVTAALQACELCLALLSCFCRVQGAAEQQTLLSPDNPSLAAGPEDVEAALARAATLRDLCQEDANLGIQLVGPIQVTPALMLVASAQATRRSARQQ